ncbi:hypothetical protein TTHERM_00219089 (macronuclear) [Tetrahymena thermophila SB210]|uniref:Uncharacterized protein n=1 Tax=Tetrahymena thermophila (strain SB210) TaxID=312017 RepID=A4VDC0_TETTS|nr:hypothetical protein TTHERM_00219089 [Tetrahymena thermophila SB210]EDK31525.1 hypothetical protein TTHERM_00219089 [Tetrahymena thermophila SB210]|eukprot:XP_001470905.1 hypothetical protein TTHERM_00219089 [Tetrahymena thermophila SB210]
MTELVYAQENNEAKFINMIVLQLINNQCRFQIKILIFAINQSQQITTKQILDRKEHQYFYHKQLLNNNLEKSNLMQKYQILHYNQHPNTDEININYENKKQIFLQQLELILNFLNKCFVNQVQKSSSSLWV